MQPRNSATATILLIAALLAGCGNDLSTTDTTTLVSITEQKDVTSTTAERPSTEASPTSTNVTVAPSSTSTTTTSPPTTLNATTAPPTSTADPADPLDWDGVQWDFGRIVNVSPEVITFDRYSLYGDSGPMASDELTEEPIVFGNTDVPYLNQNEDTRDYAIASQVEVLRLTNPYEAGNCDFETLDDPPKPDWRAMTLDALMNAPADVLGSQTSLTFNQNGEVTMIRLSYGC